MRTEHSTLTLSHISAVLVGVSHSGVPYETVRIEVEIMLIVQGESVITDQLLDRVRAAHDRGVTLYVGTLSASIHEQLREALPDSTLFASDLGWLQPDNEDEAAIGRLLLVDRETLLVSSLAIHIPATEAALWSEGSTTGLVVIARRLLVAALDADDGLSESVGE
jgi:hypothetical protein